MHSACITSRVLRHNCSKANTTPHWFCIPDNNTYAHLLFFYVYLGPTRHTGQLLTPFLPSPFYPLPPLPLLALFSPLSSTLLPC